MTSEPRPAEMTAETVIRPGGAPPGQRLRELWQYRDLFWLLALRSVLARYKQTVAGLLWTVLRPLILMGVFTFVFTWVLERSAPEGLPYPLFAFTGILPWQFFAAGLQGSTQSLVANNNMVAKVYFPRLVIPTAACVAGGIDLAINLLVFAGLLAWYGVVPGVRILLLPVFILLAAVVALGLGLIFATLNVRYRDAGHLVPFLIQVGLFASPVAYATSRVPGAWRTVYALNPLVSVIEGFRWAVLPEGTASFDPGAFAISCVVAVGLFAGGVLYFTRQEGTFADYI